MKKFIVILSLVSLLPWSLQSQVPDGYILVPIEKLRGWNSKLETISASLSLTETALAKSGDDIVSLRQDVSNLTAEIENWKSLYQALLNDSEIWTGNYTELNLQLEQLEKDFGAILTAYQELLPKLEKSLKQLRIYKTATWSLAGVSAVLLTFLILGIVYD